MGLITGLLTLPLAPVRGVTWLAEQLRAEAERQWTDPQAVRDELAELERAHADGLLTDAELDARADALVARLMGPPATAGGGRDG